MNFQILCFEGLKSFSSSRLKLIFSSRNSRLGGDSCGFLFGRWLPLLDPNLVPSTVHHVASIFKACPSTINGLSGLCDHKYAVMKIRRALVTGGSGFVGRAVVRALKEKHLACRITVTDTSSSGNICESESNLALVLADVTCSESISEAVFSFQPEVVVHATGFVPPLEEQYVR